MLVISFMLVKAFLVNRVWSDRDTWNSLPLAVKNEKMSSVAPPERARLMFISHGCRLGQTGR